MGGYLTSHIVHSLTKDKKKKSLEKLGIEPRTFSMLKIFGSICERNVIPLDHFPRCVSGCVGAHLLLKRKSVMWYIIDNERIAKDRLAYYVDEGQQLGWIISEDVVALGSTCEVCNMCNIFSD
jgi:hypothetical protein